MTGPKMTAREPVRVNWMIRGMILNDDASRAGGGTSDMPA